MKNIAVMDYSDAAIKLGRVPDSFAEDEKELKTAMQQIFGYKESECEYLISDKPITMQWMGCNAPVSRKAAKILRNVLAITLTAQAELAYDKMDEGLLAMLKWISGIYDSILENNR